MDTMSFGWHLVKSGNKCEGIMFNKHILSMLMVMLLAGCLYDDKDKRVRFNHQATVTDVIMYGDSLCSDTKSTPHILSINKDCVNGRALLELDFIDYNHRIIFLALGTNDIRKGISSDQYKDKLESVMAENMICILPNIIPNIDSVSHRLAAIDVCEVYIDPVADCEVTIQHADGIHYGTGDYEALAACLSVMI